MKYNFFHTNISEKSIEITANTLKTTYVSAGKLADEFENKLTSKFGIINPVSLNSATSALHLALEVAGIKDGDEVIIPAQTFIATGLAVLMTGAKPIFADIQLNTGNIDPLSIRDKITHKTKAIIPVHWSGYPCDMDEIHLIAKENNLIVIEDAAHAIGAEYKNKPIGSISDFTVFSFQAIKHLTTGDGGALACISKDDTYQARRRRWFDIDRENSTPSILGERVYDAIKIGYKYHMNDIAASIGLGNLEEIDNVLKHHRELGDYYYKNLSNLSGINLMNYKKDRLSSWWFCQLLVEKREDFIKMLKEKGYPASVVHLRIDKNKVFNSKNDLYNQNLYNEMQVSLPIHMGINKEIIDQIINEIKKGW